MIGLVVDSNSQMPPELARRHGVEVVPLTVTVDGVEYSEGEDLDADGFWAFFADATPEVATSQPSPGRFAAAYEAVAARGADEILSVHIGSALSGTVNSARVAAAASPVPVRVVDTGTASFAVSCCLWEAAEAVAAGATLEEAAGAAEKVAATISTVWVTGGLDLARAGGRLGAAAEEPGAVPVLTLAGGAMQVVGHAADLDQAADAMAARVQAGGPALRVGVGTADPATAPLGQALADRLVAAPEVADLMRYRVGPSVGVHSGPGTVGAVWYPTRRTGFG